MLTVISLIQKIKDWEVISSIQVAEAKKEEYHKAMRKPTPNEKTAVNKVLSHMVLDVVPTSA